MDAVHVLFRVMHISGIALLVAGLILALLNQLKLKQQAKPTATPSQDQTGSDTQMASDAKDTSGVLLDELRRRGWLITNIAAGLIIISGVYQWVRSTPAYGDIGPHVSHLILGKIALGVITLALLYLQSVDLLAGRRTKVWLIVNLLLIFVVMVMGAVVRHWRLADQFL